MGPLFFHPQIHQSHPGAETDLNYINFARMIQLDQIETLRTLLVNLRSSSVLFFTNLPDVLEDFDTQKKRKRRIISPDEENQKCTSCPIDGAGRHSF